MIEIRIVDNGLGCRPDFQYRHFVFGLNISGALCPGGRWSDWETAEYVKAEDIENGV
jgi:hypothetical protein